MSVPIPVLGYEHTGILFKNTEAMATWYCYNFGAEEVSRSEGTDPIIFLSFGKSSLLELVPAKNSSNVEPSDHCHFSLSVENLASAVKNLESIGITLEKPVFKAYDGSPVAFFRDPESNLIQFVERVSNLPLPYIK